MSLSRNVILALIVVAGLAAGTALVAGYADKPSAPAQMTCPGECDGCPLQGTDACCKTQPSNDGAGARACAKCCPAPACEERSASCCPQEAAPACCPMSGGGCGLGPCAK